ncbi:MAG TPA: enoyl-CoA hydratase/isomerase family protein [Solirubrobacteraceae bacterium]|nr:enoyl-CoA hydratase/isomerase family protein [Solirubrobacteraceae bacterium]
MSGLRADRPLPGVLRLRLNRPACHNALDRPLVEALLDAFDSPGEPVVVLGSTSPGAFCAGADLRLDDGERAEVSDRLYALYARMAACEAIVVAAVGGPAVGGGAQLAIAADLRVAAPAAFLQLAGPGHGLAVGAWGLPSLVGRGRAIDLCLSMRAVAAHEALAIGLVDGVADDADAAGLTLAAGVAALDPAAAARVKRVAWSATSALEALEAERAANRAAWSGSMRRARAAHG